MEKEKNLKEVDINEIEKLHLCNTMKSVLLEMNELYWYYLNYNSEHESHAFRVAEGIKLCMNCVKKRSS